MLYELMSKDPAGIAIFMLKDPDGIAILVIFGLLLASMVVLPIFDWWATKRTK